MLPPAKRARSDNGPLTVADCTKAVKCLTKQNARALLAGLMLALPAARDVIEAEIAKVGPVDLTIYSKKASDILNSLDDVRPSHQCGRAGEVSEKLDELMEECKEDLSATEAFAAMVDILCAAFWESGDAVQKGLFQYDDPFDGHVAVELENLAGAMSSGEKESISGAVDDLESVMKALGEYGCGDSLESVVTRLRKDLLAPRGPSDGSSASGAPPVSICVEC